MPPPKGFSFFNLTKHTKQHDHPSSSLSPTLKLQADRDFYRSGDSVTVTVEISNPDLVNSFLVNRIGFEVRGVVKLDTNWFATQKPLPGSKHRRGEHVFMECASPSIVSNQIVSSGATKTYVVRTVLPDVLPPSYKGATIRYLYFVRSTLSGRRLFLENGGPHHESIKDITELEARIPLQIWGSEKNGCLVIEEESDGSVTPLTIKKDIYWKEMDADSEWTRASETYDGVEEGYESSRDETSSVSSYNPIMGNLHKKFGSSLSLQSSLARTSSKDGIYPEGERTSISSYMAALPRLSVAEVLYDSSGDVLSPRKSTVIASPNQQRKHIAPPSTDDDTGVPSVPETIEPVASEGFVRGRSYNIRLDDQVLLRLSPKNSDSAYYFSDMIGGTLTFFHEGSRRCLEVLVTLEISETIGRRFVHPSRRNSPTITKVQSDHHEVVADLVQTSFLFSIPMDGPMSFSTPHVSVQWALRFEFFTTPKNVDWTRYDHPLLIDGRDKGEWVLPITVHAPPPRTPSPHARNDKPYSLEPSWVRT